MPEPEKLLWAKLRDKELHGHKFRRQCSVDKFLLDFYCPQLKLAVEIDGDSHFAAGAGDCDRDRQQIIESYGISFLRFTNAEVMGNIDGVVLKIMEYLP